MSQERTNQYFSYICFSEVDTESYSKLKVIEGKATLESMESIYSSSNTNTSDPKRTDFTLPRWRTSSLIVCKKSLFWLKFPTLCVTKVKPDSWSGNKVTGGVQTKTTWWNNKHFWWGETKASFIMLSICNIWKPHRCAHCKISLRKTTPFFFSDFSTQICNMQYCSWAHIRIYLISPPPLQMVESSWNDTTAIWKAFPAAACLFNFSF